MAERKLLAKDYENFTEEEKREYKEQIEKKSKRNVIVNRVITVCIVLFVVFALFVGARVAWVRYVCLETENDEAIIREDYTLFGGNIKIPEKMFGFRVTAIGDNAFEESRIRSVVIPDSVTHIGDKAFHSCKNLKGVVISDSVTSIGISVFSGCENLERAVLSNNMTEIPPGIFSSCRKLKEVIYPEDKITKIGEKAFMSCESLESFVIPNNVIELGHHQFTFCTSLKSVKIGSGITELPHGTFMSCGLREIEIPENVKIIDDNAFSGTEITITAPHEPEYYTLIEESLPGYITWVTNNDDK